MMITDKKTKKIFKNYIDKNNFKNCVQKNVILLFFLHEKRSKTSTLRTLVHVSSSW